MSKHKDFILTPICTVLKDTVRATSGLGNGIEAYPLSDYIMQTTFMKMTGFQEQKCKCIIWELATNNYSLRYKYLNNDLRLGECSTLKSKETIFYQIINNIKENKEFDERVFFNDKEIVEETKINIKKIFADSNLVLWSQRDFDYFSYKETFFRENQLLQYNNNKMVLFQSSLTKLYDSLYFHRNRIAHNTLSYQQNLPDLKVLENETEESRNYFMWFTILALIDSVYIELYKEYLDSLEENIY